MHGSRGLVLMGTDDFRAAVGGVRPGRSLPETPHELPIDRTRVDALLDRVRQGARISQIGRAHV